MRTDKRSSHQLREIKFTPNIIEHAEGSVIIECGRTKVICTASLEETLPKWLLGSKQGWVTAEYGMLPRSTHTRIKRDKALTGGRSQEISRLVGRSLRTVTDLKQLGELSLIIDCDVIQADGGTRTASITGGFVAMVLGFKKLKDDGILPSIPVKDYVSAVSVGLREHQMLLDLNYEEDSQVDTDMNFVMTGAGQFVEIQGTAEKVPFTKKQMDEMTDLATKGCRELIDFQKQVLEKYIKI